MKKNAIFVLVTVSIIAFCLASIPNVFSQTQDIKILSSSWHISPYTNDLVVIGEAQNTGPNVIDYIIIAGTFSNANGTALMSSHTAGYATQILPQEKTPFYMDFSPESVIGDYVWGSGGITNITLSVTVANQTDKRQYPDLAVTSSTATTDANGDYLVTGVVQNTGTQPTNKTWVLATFYDSGGIAIGMGYSAYLSPASIPPGGVAPFTIYPLDYAQSLVDKIASYGLLIQTLLTASSTTPTPSPSSTPTSSSSPSPSSSPTPTSTGPGTGTNIPDVYLYAAIAAVIVVIAIAVAALVWRKRGKKQSNPSTTAAEANQPS